MAELIQECILIIYREKYNVTLADEAGKIIEYLDMTCGYLLKKRT